MNCKLCGLLFKKKTPNITPLYIKGISQTPTRSELSMDTEITLAMVSQTGTRNAVEIEVDTLAMVSQTPTRNELSMDTEITLAMLSQTDTRSEVDIDIAIHMAGISQTPTRNELTLTTTIALAGISQTPTRNELTLTDNSIYVTDYWVGGDANWNAAIVRATAVLVAAGGGLLNFPEGDYLIAPIVYLDTKVTWQGRGTVRLYSEETSIYNYLIYSNAKNNVAIKNITIDQRGDSALLPTLSPYVACMGLYFSFSDEITIEDCTFYCYGILGVFIDAWDSATEVTKNVYFKGNYMYWQRKVNSWYDVSVVHIQATSIYFEDNWIEGMVTSMETHLPRTGFESHMPNGYIKNNTFKNCQVGALNVPWPSHWIYYNSGYSGSLSIDHNTLVNCGAYGFELWLGLKGNGRNLKNLTIEYNTIGLYLKNNQYSKPATAIIFYRGSTFTAEADGVTINNNDIELTWDTNYVANITAVMYAYNYLIGGADTGTFLLNIENTLKNIEIYSNTVQNMPYSLLNVYRRNAAGTNFHENIDFHDNTSSDGSYALPYTDQMKSCFTYGAVNGITIEDNAISNPNIALLEQKDERDNVTNDTYTNNSFT